MRCAIQIYLLFTYLLKCIVEDSFLFRLVQEMLAFFKKHANYSVAHNKVARFCSPRCVYNSWSSLQLYEREI